MTTANIQWDNHNEGRSGGKGETMDRFMLTPEKFEMVDGKLLWSDEDREILLGCCWKTSARTGLSAFTIPRCGAPQWPSSRREQSHLSPVPWGRVIVR